MSKIYSGKSSINKGLEALQKKIDTFISDSGSALKNDSLVSSVVGFESLNDNNKQLFNNTIENISENLLDFIRESFSSSHGSKTVNSSFESFFPALTNDLDSRTYAERKTNIDNALTSAAIAMTAIGDPLKYHKQAISPIGFESFDMGLSGKAGNLDYRTNSFLNKTSTGFESFDNRSLNDYMSFSIVFNLFALRQDEAAELLFPTVVVTPDQTGIQIEATRYLVWDVAYHQSNGAAYPANKFNLLDAAVDPGVLNDDTLNIVPVVQSDGSNIDKFISSSLVATKNVVISNVSVPTAPLKPGINIDILGLSQYPALIGANLMNNTDSLGERIALDAIYLDASTTGQNAQTIAVEFSTTNLPYNQFRYAVEGNFRQMNLNFHSNDLVISSNTKGVDGSTVTLFSDIVSGGYIARLSINVTGSVNVETGNVIINQTTVLVDSITDSSGNDISLTTGIGLTIVNKLQTMKFAGYDLLATRTNTNRRSRGKMLDYTVDREQRAVYLNAPFTFPRPLSADNTGEDINTLIAASRIRNTNNAFTKLFNYAETLKNLVSVAPRKGQIPKVEGIGRFFLQPFYEEHNLDLLTSINSISTGDKAQDMQAVFTNTIRDIAYRMYQNSRFKAAIDQFTNGSGSKPTLKIVTDQTIIRHLMVTGDTRTFGTVFDKFIIKDSLDYRMTNKIVLMLALDEVGGVHPLGGGNFIWCPELISVAPVTRDGAIFQEPMVQPRTTHIMNTPVMAIINVQNLSQALVYKTSTPALDSVVATTYSNGLTTQNTDSNPYVAFPPGSP